MPVAWAISDREDTDTIEAFWTAVKSKCPNAVISNLMTDDGKVYLLINRERSIRFL